MRKEEKNRKNEKNRKGKETRIKYNKRKEK